MLYLIDPNTIGKGCKTYCATYKPCPLDFAVPLYSVPNDES